jgi:hypothetical protein
VLQVRNKAQKLAADEPVEVFRSRTENKTNLEVCISDSLFVRGSDKCQVCILSMALEKTHGGYTIRRYKQQNSENGRK